MSAGELYLTKLKANGLHVFPTNGDTLHALETGADRLRAHPAASAVTGEVLKARTTSSNYVPKIVDLPGSMLFPAAIGIDKKGPTPNQAEAEAFVKYVLSPAGQAVMQTGDPTGDSPFWPIVPGSALPGLRPFPRVSEVDPYFWGPRKARSTTGSTRTSSRSVRERMADGTLKRPRPLPTRPDPRPADRIWIAPSHSGKPQSLASGSSSSRSWPAGAAVPLSRSRRGCSIRDLVVHALSFSQAFSGTLCRRRRFAVRRNCQCRPRLPHRIWGRLAGDPYGSPVPPPVERSDVRTPACAFVSGRTRLGAAPGASGVLDMSGFHPDVVRTRSMARSALSSCSP